jgi:type III secretory pathway lipoprotein EscJ
MPDSAQINLKLDFNQILDLVRQLPKKQQQQLVGMLGKEEIPAKKITAKEQSFLSDLDQAVDFVNNYPKGKETTKSFKQMLDAL